MKLGNKYAQTHGMSHTSVYRVWRNMKDRCGLPSHPFWEEYGGRGIHVCRRWLTFENFWTDMGPSYERGLTLDRKHNNKGYTKANCHWVTIQRQQSNRRSNRHIRTVHGTLTLSDTARAAGICKVLLRWRYDRGWRGPRLLQKPS